MFWSLHIGLAVAACIVTALATGAALRLLQARAIMDHPNERSSHDRAVPRGGGIAVMAVVTFGCGLIAWWRGDSFNLYTVAILAAGLAAVSFIDDLRGLPAYQRLALQALAVALGCLALPEAGVFQGLLPPAADRLLAAFFWLWFVNLYNFMDGIDGITAVETTAICIGLAGVSLTGGIATDLAAPALLTAGAAVGFGIWNWRPAKIFLGDVGSVGLGFLLGWLLLSLAASGHWLPALLLPLYYVTDATWTLLRRAIRGEKIWQAHRSHFYQYAVRRCGDHGKVSSSIALCNLVLISAALWASLGGSPWPPLALGGAAVAVLLYYFANMTAVDEANQS